MKLKVPISTEIKIINDKYQEHLFTPNRKDNYVPKELIFSNADFSRVEQRLFELFINQLNHGDIDPSQGIEVRIPIVEVRKYVETRQVMAVTKSMAQKVITMSDISKSELEFKHFPVFTSIEYNIDKSGYLVFRSNPQLSPYLVDLGKSYARYNFQTIQAFKSIYSTLMYRLLKYHIGQNRMSFVYSLIELRKLLKIEPHKYQHLKGFKTFILDIVQRECATAEHPIAFDYENEGNKQRNITHIRFNIITAITFSQIEKQQFQEAVELNPEAVYLKVEEILDKNYTFREEHKRKILESQNLLSTFITLHIEFENGIYPKVKNKSAYILTCLGLVKKK